MVRVWYMDDDTKTDQREPHMKDPSAFLTLDQLKEKTGVEYFKFDAENIDQNEDFINLKKERGYTYEDDIDIAREKLPNYDEQLKIFFTEHIHPDEEVRLIEAGTGYFDVRDQNDQWVRIELEKDDMIILPAGIYHRFTLDTKNYIKARRMFVSVPKWTPINRPGADQHASHVEYLKAHPPTKTN